ncbi:MAG: hypothetical protein L0Z62_28105 [Gemmataceae bacterium]|nr:hypothetical protein [Gemmataceae bacterium]
MNSATDPLGTHLLGEVPAPVLLNTWKHHAGALRQRIEEVAALGQAGLEELAERLVVVGTELMDLYTGALTPAEIAARVIAALRAAGRLEPEAYRAWLRDSGGYGVIDLAEDGSRWVLRAGEEGERYVHVHPARWAPCTRRVRANVLKTAVMVLAHTAVHGGDPLNVRVVNTVREKYLGLSRMRALTDDGGLSAMIEVLRSR